MVDVEILNDFIVGNLEILNIFFEPETWLGSELKSINESKSR